MIYLIVDLHISIRKDVFTGLPQYIIYVDIRDSGQSVSDA